ncbi:site-specific integrase [Lelliottia steviae]|uniref:site-specific integrase n=1 Tax=Pseudoalteromonas sp. TaxID=53249 RepID=UPI001881F021|nr:site-specific integrase [Lelliottia steviae]
MSLKASKPEKFQNSRIEEVLLLDKRVVAIDFSGETMISSDMKDHIFDFSWAIPNGTAKESLLTCFRKMFRTHSLTYIESCNRYIGRLFAGGRQGELITLNDIQIWADNHRPSAWPFLQAILNRCQKLGLPGLDVELIAFLKSPEKFEEKGKGAYFALIVNDSKRGAFTEQELRNIREGVNRAYESGDLDTYYWALIWLLIGTGVRPVQIARMKVKDVIITSGPEGKEVTLAVPMAKGEKSANQGKWKRKAPSVLSEVLINYLNQQANKNPEDPLFADQSSKIANDLKVAFQSVKTHSDRLDGPIPIYSYRFRYTLGTRAIALGATDHEAARLLTHRQTVCIKHYRASLPSVQQPLKDAIGKEMSFIGQAFQGRLVSSLEEATRQHDSGALIRDFANLIGLPIGACGTMANCYQHAPRACLTCRKFEPFQDAPWDELLAVLQSDIDSEIEERIRLITVEQYVAVKEILNSIKTKDKESFK